MKVSLMTWVRQFAANIVGAVATYAFFLGVAHNSTQSDLSTLLTLQAIVTIPISFFDMVTLQQITQDSFYRRFGSSVALNEVKWRHLARERVVALLTPGVFLCFQILGGDLKLAVLETLFVMSQSLWVLQASAMAISEREHYWRMQVFGFFLVVIYAAILGLSDAQQTLEQMLFALALIRIIGWLPFAWIVRKATIRQSFCSSVASFRDSLRDANFSPTLVLNFANAATAQVDTLLARAIGPLVPASYQAAQRPMLGLSVLAVSISQSKTQASISGEARITRREVVLHMLLVIASPAFGVAGWLLASWVTPKSLMPDPNVFVVLALGFTIGAIASTTGPVLLMSGQIRTLVKSSIAQLLILPVFYFVAPVEESLALIAWALVLSKTAAVVLQARAVSRLDRM